MMSAEDDKQPLLHKRHKVDEAAAAVKNGVGQYGTTESDSKPSTDDSEQTPKSVSIAQLVSMSLRHDRVDTHATTTCNH